MSLKILQVTYMIPSVPKMGLKCELSQTSAPYETVQCFKGKKETCCFVPSVKEYHEKLLPAKSRTLSNQ